jgi:hypothetical protein
MRFTHRIPVVLILVLAGSLPIYSQVQTSNYPFGSFAGGPDVINLSNLNTRITIPILHKPGRGIDFAYDLTIDSSVWYPVGAPGSQVWTNDSSWGWSPQTTAAVGYLDPPSVASYGSSCIDDTGHRHSITITKTTYRGFRDPLGIFHPIKLMLVSGFGSCGGDVTEATALAKDGSGWKLDVPSGTATSATGKTYALGTIATAQLSMTLLATPHPC